MIIDNLKKLASFKTISITDQPEEFNKLYDFVAAQLSSLNLIKKEYRNEQYLSVFWGTVENPDLLFTAHVDVVPAADEMFAPTQDDEKLSGRGILDMKFAIAGFIQVLNSIENIKDYSIGILLTPDEEVGGFNGLKYVLDNSALNPKAVILPDGGAQMSIEYAEKGIVHARITAHGKSAHGSRPWLGENAIEKLIETYAKVTAEIKNPKSDEWVTTVNAGKISGGVATNVVPDQAALDLDFRVVSESDRTKIKNLLSTLSKDPGIEAEVLVEGPSFELDKNDPYLLKYLDISEEITGQRPPLIPSAGASDARFFTEKNIPVIINRPLGDGIHSDNEWIDLKSLDRFTKILTEFAKLFKV